MPPLRVAALLLTFAAASSAKAQELPAQADSVHAGCYLFDRPLGHSADGDRERADAAWYRVELRPGGSVSRLQLPSAYWRREYAAASRWRAEGDSLVILQHAWHVPT